MGSRMVRKWERKVRGETNGILLVEFTVVEILERLVRFTVTVKDT